MAARAVSGRGKLLRAGEPDGCCSPSAARFWPGISLQRRPTCLPRGSPCASSSGARGVTATAQPKSSRRRLLRLLRRRRRDGRLTRRRRARPRRSGRRRRQRQAAALSARQRPPGALGRAARAALSCLANTAPPISGMPNVPSTARRVRSGGGRFAGAVAPRPATLATDTLPQRARQKASVLGGTRRARGCRRRWAWRLNVS